MKLRCWICSIITAALIAASFTTHAYSHLPLYEDAKAERRDSVFLHCMDLGFTRCEQEGYDPNTTNCGGMIIRACLQIIGQYDLANKERQ